MPRGLFRFGCHRYHAGVLNPALGGNREYFHSQTNGDSDRLKREERSISSNTAE